MAKAEPRAPISAAPLSLQREEGRATVSGDGFQLSFSAEGGLERMVWRNHPVIVAGPRLQLWRGPTDNDGIKAMPPRNGRTLARWREAGLDRATLGPIQFTVTAEDGLVAIRLEQVAACAASPRAVVFRHDYRIGADGRIAVDCAFQVDPAISDLPRLGVSLTLPDEFEQMQWFGRGPGETYADRKRAGWIGRFAGTVREQYVPYAVPQEHGNKTELRWIEAASPQVAVRFTPAAPCERSPQPASRRKDLFAAAHTTDLTPARRGCGSTSTSPSAASAPPAADPTRWSAT